MTRQDETVLVSILYMSRASVPFDDGDMQELLTAARLRNTALGVSGLLVAKGGRFMQLLEGPAWSVDDRFAAISRDARHGDVKSLVREDIDRRRFDGWAMAYRALEDADVEQQEGFSPFLTSDLDFPPEFDRTSSAWLLKWFRSRELTDS
ncbi:BLUF domain-containing protein [Curtobacterium luteum]|uniref:BLUF domain-containing protein n=1 Tax=Curtobacterium luteum TaxID=33881 RepID=UPI00380864F7